MSRCTSPLLTHIKAAAQGLSVLFKLMCVHQCREQRATAQSQVQFIIVFWHLKVNNKLGCFYTISFYTKGRHSRRYLLYYCQNGTERSIFNHTLVCEFMSWERPCGHLDMFWTHVSPDVCFQAQCSHVFYLFMETVESTFLGVWEVYTGSFYGTAL